MICVFDIETIPDVELLKKVYGYSGSDIEVCEMAFAEQEKKSGYSFLPVTFHKIISIASVIGDEYGRFDRVGVFGRKSSILDSEIEANVLGDFLKFINKSQPKLVSFNGRGFDLPTIMLRAMKYGIDCSAYFEQDNPKFNKNKWENYRHRYSERFHIDLMDSLSEFGSVRGINLDSISVMLGLPGKYDVSGGDVYKLYFDNQLEKIDSYCQSDTLNTYWVYLKYELLRRNISTEDYVSILDGFRQKLPKDREFSPIFLEAIDKEILAFGG